MINRVALEDLILSSQEPAAITEFERGKLYWYVGMGVSVASGTLLGTWLGLTLRGWDPDPEGLLVGCILLGTLFYTQAKQFQHQDRAVKRYNQVIAGEGPLSHGLHRPPGTQPVPGIPPENSQWRETQFAMGANK